SDVILLDALDSLAETARGRREAIDQLAKGLSDALHATGDAVDESAFGWILRQGDEAEAWFAPYLNRLFAHADQREDWERLRDLVPAEHRPAFARIALHV